MIKAWRDLFRTHILEREAVTSLRSTAEEQKYKQNIKLALTY